MIKFPYKPTFPLLKPQNPSISFYNHCKIIPHFFSRQKSTSDDEYRNRKTSIANDHLQYYPSLSQLNPHYDTKLRVPDFFHKFNNVNFNDFPQKRTPSTYKLQGKIESIRKSGKGLYFIDLIQDNFSIQIMANNNLMGLEKPQFHEIHHDLRKGDYIDCIGHASVTNVGELTLKLVTPVALVTPCLNTMVVPERLVDRKLINSNKVLNYLVDNDAKQRIMVKSQVIQSVRNYLLSRQFLEVQTPLLQGNSTGANATPFTTASKYVDADLQLRVAPELWLKKLVIGGFEKIFEIGQSFRNEGIDSTHNPEFTTCEFYQSFIDLNDLMDMTQGMLLTIYRDIAARGDTLAIAMSRLTALEPLIDPSYVRYEFIPTLESQTGHQLPPRLDSTSLVQYHQILGLEIPKVVSPASLLDNLASIYLEPLHQTTNKPVFIYHHPTELSPLSKSTTITYGGRHYEISRRFELFIAGNEYVNAYEEENSPFEQLKKFQLQQLSKSDYNDHESLVPDWNYVELMEYGLPPTGGWGCGIDRLAMLFCGVERIEDVLTFGSVRDVVRN